MERFYFDKKLTPGAALEVKDPEIVHKISRVLRLKIGSGLKIFDNSGKEFAAKVLEINKGSIKIAAGAEEIVNTEPESKINLYCALIKKSRFEIILEKCTELGVMEFFPIITERSVVQTESSPERWKKIIIEAAQQSGRTRLPIIQAPTKLETALKNISAGEQIIIASEKEGTRSIAKAVESLDLSKAINLFIGPEGGWALAELADFEKFNPVKLNLGSRILRAETAAIVFSGFCIYLGKNKQF